MLYSRILLFFLQLTGGNLLIVIASEYEKNDIYKCYFSQHEETYVCLKQYKNEEYTFEVGGLHTP